MKAETILNAFIAARDRLELAPLDSQESGECFWHILIFEDKLRKEIRRLDTLDAKAGKRTDVDRDTE